MALNRRGNDHWYKFRLAGREIRESAKTPLETLAKKAEQKRRPELEEGYNDLVDHRETRVQKRAWRAKTINEEVGFETQYVPSDSHMRREFAIEIARTGSRHFP